MSKIHNFSVHCIFGQLKGLIINHLICDQRYLLVADWPISISSLNLPGRSNLLTRMWSWAYTELLQKLYTLRYFSCTYRLNLILRVYEKRPCTFLLIGHDILFWWFARELRCKSIHCCHWRMSCRVTCLSCGNFILRMPIMQMQVN